jgi:hypothetical protein
MNRRKFIYNTTFSAFGLMGLCSFDKQLLSNPNIKITLTPWSLIRSGYGGNDPLNIDLLNIPKVAKSLGFDYIDHEMFHFPPNLNQKYINNMNNAMESAGVKSAVMLTGGKGDVGDKDQKKRSKALATYKYWIDIAAPSSTAKRLEMFVGRISQYPIKKNLIMPYKGLKN